VETSSQETECPRSGETPQFNRRETQVSPDASGNSWGRRAVGGRLMLSSAPHVGSTMRLLESTTLAAGFLGREFEGGRA